MKIKITEATVFGKQQTLPQPLGSYGCYFLSLLYYAKIVSNSSEEQFQACFNKIYDIYKACEDKSFVTENCFVTHPLEIFRNFIKLLNPTCTTSFVSVIKLDVDLLVASEVVIANLASTSGLNHFVVGAKEDLNFNVIYDPWAGGSPVARNGRLLSIRKFI